MNLTHDRRYAAIRNVQLTCTTSACIGPIKIVYNQIKFNVINPKSPDLTHLPLVHCSTCIKANGKLGITKWLHFKFSARAPAKPTLTTLCNCQIQHSIFGHSALGFEVEDCGQGVWPMRFMHSDGCGAKFCTRCGTRRRRFPYV